VVIITAHTHGEKRQQGAADGQNTMDRHQVVEKKNRGNFPKKWYRGNGEEISKMMNLN